MDNFMPTDKENFNKLLDDYKMLLRLKKHPEDIDFEIKALEIKLSQYSMEYKSLVDELK